jgi:hypothetical protein
LILLRSGPISRALRLGGTPATVEQEQRIGFDGFRGLASAQLALRRVDRFPDPLPHVVE